MPDARRLGQLALTAWMVLVLLWILDVNGPGVAPRLPRLLGVLAVVLTLGFLVGRGRRLLSRQRAHGLLFLGLLALGIALGFAGLGHEVGRGYYADEGHYLHHAREVNEGEPFTRSFVYPHLTYYLDGFALWLAELFAAPVAGFASTFYGVNDAKAVPWLVLRLVTAALGVLTLVPVFFLALRVAGLPAASLAGALVILSVHYQKGFQVNLSDVPSAFFATLCFFFVGRLLEEERTRDYVWAGLASGLAAAAKYPAGVVAVAIVAVWAVHRVRRRSWSWGLLWAGLASLGAFLACNPSLFVHTEAALHGRRGLLFGVRQYDTGGWVGVLPDSNTLYYLGRLLLNFRWPAVVLAVAGLFGLETRARRRLLMLLPFPLVYFGLICSMNMVVLRNLFPVIPALAVVLGVAVSGLERLAEVRAPRRRRLAWAAITAATLAWPAAAALRQTVTFVRPSTRDVMVDWVRDHVPVGAGILKETATPDFSPYEYRTLKRRFAYRIGDERFADPRFDFLLLAGSAYGRWLRPERGDRPWGDWYRRVFEAHELVHQVDSGPWRQGPELRLYRLPEHTDPDGSRSLSSADAFLTHPSMRGTGVVRFTPRGRTAVFAAAFGAGRYTVEVEGSLSAAGELRIRGLDGRLLTETSLGVEAVEVQLTQSGKYFLAVELPKGSRIRGLTVESHFGEETL